MEAQKLKTRKEIAHELGISPRTLRRWIRNKSIKLPTGLLNIKYQKLLFDKLLAETE
jgi:DNA-directed RNA polymerase specialized sigma54-like protein